jgi:hypothetical protein
MIIIFKNVVASRIEGLRYPPICLFDTLFSCQCPFNFQCGSAATCTLEIRTGVEKTGPLFASFTSASPPGSSLLVPGSQIYIKYSATDPAVRFLATWSCTEEGGLIFYSGHLDQNPTARYIAT